MVISTRLVGTTIEPHIHEIDERWTMAYAASLGLDDQHYHDTTTTEGVIAHPVFAVCPEWPVIVALRDRSVDMGLTPAEVLTSVHATHDTTLHRLIRPGDQLSTTLEVAGMQQITPGVLTTTRLLTVDADGQPVATTSQDGIYLGQQLEGEDRPAVAFEPRPQPDRVGEPAVTEVPVVAGASHIYTECARIWNPIHTDKAVALASGLPDIILHGTANLAHGVSAVVRQQAGNDPRRVKRITCRFAAMVRLPSTMTVRVWPGDAYGVDVAVPFEVLNEQGQPAVKDGVVVLSS